MNTIIKLPHSLLFEDTHAYSCGWWLRDEVYSWLKKHVGPGSQCGGWTDDCKWMWIYTFIDGGPSKNMMSFEDPQMAMLFKLTWHE